MPLPLLNRLALLLLLGAAASPALAEWRDVPYAEMAKLPLALSQADPKHIYATRYTAKAGDGQASLPADLRIQVRTGGRTLPVTIGPDGHVNLAIRRDWATGGAVVQINQPRGRVKLSLSFEARTPAGTRMSYASLAESAPVMEQGLRQMAEAMAESAPRVQFLVLSFARLARRPSPWRCRAGSSNRGRPMPKARPWCPGSRNGWPAPCS